MNGFDLNARRKRLAHRSLALAIYLLLALALAIPLNLGVLSSGAEANGRAYSLDFSAADPANYAKLLPGNLPNPAPSGGSGRASSPLANAIYGDPKVSVESLAPDTLALGQIVPFEVRIQVDGDTSPENGTIGFRPYFSTKTSSGADFGYDPAYGIYSAFIDHGDPATVNGGTAKVDSYTSTVAGPGTSDEQIQGTIEISGLQDGDTAILEIWVVLKATILPGSNGTVQSGVIDAHTLPPSPDLPAFIGVGNQTIPLLRVQEFFNAAADVSVTKSDLVDPIMPGEGHGYDITVTNNSTTTTASGVVVTDTLDTNVTFMVASGPVYDISLSGNAVTYQVGLMAPGQSVTLNLIVTVNSDAPANNDTSTNPEPGSNTLPSLFDILNIVTVSSTTNDPDTSNNTYYQPTNVGPAQVNEADVAITKEAPAAVQAGGDITYKLVVTNNGPSAAVNVMVTESYPPGFTYGSASPDPDSGTNNQWSLGNLAPGASASINIYGTAPSEPATLVNTAAVASDTPDSNMQNNAAEATTKVIKAPGVAHITLTKAVEPLECPEAGAILTYTLSATNDGQVGLTEVLVTDPMLGPLMATWPDPLYPGRLLPGQTVTLTGQYTITAEEAALGRIANTAYVTAMAGSAAVTDEASVTYEFSIEPPPPPPPAPCEGNTTGIVASIPVPTGGSNEYALLLEIVCTSVPGLSAGQMVWLAAETTDFPDLLTVGVTLSGNLDHSRGWWVLFGVEECPDPPPPPPPPPPCGNTTGVVVSVPVPTGGDNEYAFLLEIACTSVREFSPGRVVWCAATTDDFSDLLTVGTTLTGDLDHSLGWWVLEG